MVLVILSSFADSFSSLDALPEFRLPASVVAEPKMVALQQHRLADMGYSATRARRTPGQCDVEEANRA